MFGGGGLSYAQSAIFQLLEGILCIRLDQVSLKHPLFSPVNCLPRVSCNGSPGTFHRMRYRSTMDNNSHFPRTLGYTSGVVRHGLYWRGNEGQQSLSRAGHRRPVSDKVQQPAEGLPSGFPTLDNLLGARGILLSVAHPGCRTRRSGLSSQEPYHHQGGWQWISGGHPGEKVNDKHPLLTCQALS
ncbi:hypothetical protein BJX61DRAFT_212926 [Aspergillus egyptiacus]|nr:hypothetical protein BJX61DRAFT_212926 [Aspergillus egyptiacus]